MAVIMAVQTDDGGKDAGPDQGGLDLAGNRFGPRHAQGGPGTVYHWRQRRPDGTAIVLRVLNHHRAVPMAGATAQKGTDETTGKQTVKGLGIGCMQVRPAATIGVKRDQLPKKQWLAGGRHDRLGPGTPALLGVARLLAEPPLQVLAAAIPGRNGRLGLALVLRPWGT